MKQKKQQRQWGAAESDPKCTSACRLKEHWWHMKCRCERFSFSFTFWAKSVSERQIFTEGIHTAAWLVFIFVSVSACITFLLFSVFFSIFVLHSSPLFLTFLLPLEPSVAQFSICNSFCLPFLPSFMKLPQSVAQHRERKAPLFSSRFDWQHPLHTSQ